MKVNRERETSFLDFLSQNKKHRSQAALQKAFEKPRPPSVKAKRIPPPAVVTAIKPTESESCNSPISKLNPLKHFQSFEPFSPTHIREKSSPKQFTLDVENVVDSPRVEPEARESFRSQGPTKPLKSSLTQVEVQKTGEASKKAFKVKIQESSANLLLKSRAGVGSARPGLATERSSKVQQSEHFRLKKKSFKIPFNSNNLESMILDLKKAGIDPNSYVEDKTGLGFDTPLSPFFFKNMVPALLEGTLDHKPTTVRVMKAADPLPFPQLVTRQKVVKQNSVANMVSSAFASKHKDEAAKSYSNHSLEVLSYHAAISPLALLPGQPPRGGPA